MRFNLVHILPDPRLHGLRGYEEVIETVRWGLAELGHDVTIEINTVRSDRRNILFGFQMLTEPTLRAMPADTIVCNFEQMARVPQEKLLPMVRTAAMRLQIWDYSQANIAAWRALNPAHEPLHVPIGFAPTLLRIPRRAQDIDVLFYGAPGEARLRIFGEIASRGITSMFACGLYGAARDELIARSKLVLNLNRLDTTRIFEAVRVSYLLANAKAVVSDFHPESIIEPDFREAVAFASPDQIPSLCVRLVEDDSLRRRLEGLGPQVMRRRDIRPILANVIAQTS
jgi:hypothetical protein